MGTKTIGLDEEAYERLRAEKREDESFSDVVKRVTAEVSTDWQRGFGKYDGAAGERLERAAAERRERRSQGLAERERAVVQSLHGDTECDDTVTDGDPAGSDES